MDREEIRVAVLRIEGTNCEDETVSAFRALGVEAEAIHLKQFYSDMIRDDEARNIWDYSAVVFPGGFSAGDYVRAGAIFSARIKSKLRHDLELFIKEGYAVLGICNGFQILVELGALPGFDEDRPVADKPQMALAINDSSRFECRQSYLKHENSGNCIFTKLYRKNEVVVFPVAHAEGKVTFPVGREEEYLQRLEENDQIVFRYVDGAGNYAGYPWNPNGSFSNIAGICNVKGNVFGLMPHPERVIHPWQHSDWARRQRNEGDGLRVFKSVIEYLERL
ncbi:phosphoribosylformylglycinamidine synthase subunit PurQ [Geoglobus acetivorans]|uniref:Phosphoribosylformylglycinamidine synthase subunit PurQ n=1 Tax=Geoglobus acetivorans TaxID=565033 RepID=A0A0A7GG48_GEOAI|nr:Phosphoribosylformylglycinamidine synthase, glutamine amidotransferase subunit [Geoglobus acetivorans]